MPGARSARRSSRCSLRADRGRSDRYGLPGPIMRSARRTRRSPVGSSIGSRMARSPLGRTSSASGPTACASSTASGCPPTLSCAAPVTGDLSVLSTPTSCPRPTTASALFRRVFSRSTRASRSSGSSSRSARSCRWPRRRPACSPTTCAASTGCRPAGARRRPPRARPPAQRYVASPRHTIQVDVDGYLHALDRERGRGARRPACGRPRPGAARTGGGARRARTGPAA